MASDSKHVCGQCGREMDGPEDWGKCFYADACLRRQLAALRARVIALESK